MDTKILYTFLTALGASLISVPLTTLFSLWVKWRWENPKIKNIFLIKKISSHENLKKFYEINNIDEYATAKIGKYSARINFKYAEMAKHSLMTSTERIIIIEKEKNDSGFIVYYLTPKSKLRRRFKGYYLNIANSKEFINKFYNK